jgi:YfiH family protein
LSALGLERIRGALVTAEQVHGVNAAQLGRGDAGRGAHAADGPRPISSTDALVTSEEDLPMLMLFADCVPVVLVSEAQRAVALVHGGWRGVLSGVLQNAVESLCELSGERPSSLLGYVGPHIGECCYEVDDELVSQFCNTFDTIAPAEGRLDLAAAVQEALVGSGLPDDRIVHAGLCTLDNPERFFSFRGRATTGRHGAFAVITKGGNVETARDVGK